MAVRLRYGPPMSGTLMFPAAFGVAARLDYVPRYKLTHRVRRRPLRRLAAAGHAPSVQEALEAARCAIDGEPVDGHRRRAHGFGRARAGAGRPPRFPEGLRADMVRDALNAHLRPHPIAMLEAEDAAPDSTRASTRPRAAISIASSTAGRTSRSNATGPGAARALDADAMHAAAQALVGRHDFSTFRDSQCQADSPVKTLIPSRVMRARRRVAVDTSARSFLHRQVRSMVGSLVEVGRGKEGCALDRRYPEGG